MEKNAKKCKNKNNSTINIFQTTIDLKNNN